MAQVIPTIRVRERETLQHWVEAFGLELQAVFPEDGVAVDHAQLRLGDGWIMSGTPREDGIGQPPGTGATYWVVADAAEVDAIHERAVAAGATSLHSREGNLWSFGTYAPGDG